MDEFKNLKRVAMNELRKLDAAYANKDEFIEADVKKYDCLMHGLSCQLKAEAMLGASEYGYDYGQMSGRPGHMGRMNMSGHYPEPDYPYHYPPNRW